MHQPLANAYAMVPNLIVDQADDMADAMLLEKIADWCERFSPYVAIDPPHGLLIDVTGVTHLFGGEAEMLATVQRAIARQAFSVRVGMAGTARAAWALSHFESGHIAQPATEGETLALLPVAALNCGDEIMHALRRAGLKTIGQLASRRRDELTARFGKHFVHILEQALAQNQTPISPRRPLPDFVVEHRFADPVTAQSVLRDTLYKISKNLSLLLEEKGLGARALEAVFFRADGVVRRLPVETGAAVRDPALIDRLFRIKLDSLADPLDPGFGFDVVCLKATLTEKVSSEISSIDGGDSKSEGEINQLIDRLSTRFGAQRVIRFHAQDTHIPEAASIGLPAQSREKTGVAWRRLSNIGEIPCRPLRFLSHPEPIFVIGEVPDGPPLRFRWRGVLHHSTFVAGPETIAMQWWHHQTSPPTRDYFRVEDSEGRRYWLFRQGPYGGNQQNWFMHGLFA